MKAVATMADEGTLQQEELRVLQHMPHVMAQTHWHSHIEVFLLTSGRIWTELHGHEIEIAAGRIGLFWASYPHRVTRIDTPGRIYVLNVPMRRFRAWNLSMASKLAVMRGELVVAREAVPYQQALFDLWLGDVATTRIDQQDLMFDEAHSCLRRLDRIGWISGTSQRGRLPTSELRLSARVESMIRFVDGNFHRSDLRVEHVATEAGLHPNYAMAVFKDAMGISVGNYLTHVRLSEAQQMLLTTTNKILAVASDCGFASPSRFYAAFQAHLGTTPTNYRDRTMPHRIGF